VRKLLGLVTLFTLFCPWRVESQQQVILYVNRTDLTCGGQSPCYTKIQAAVDAAQSGNIVRIQAGTYPEQISIEKNKFPNATEFDRIVIEGDPTLQPGQVVLTGAPGPQCTDSKHVGPNTSDFTAAELGSSFCQSRVATFHPTTAPRAIIEARSFNALPHPALALPR